MSALAAAASFALSDQPPVTTTRVFASGLTDRAPSSNALTRGWIGLLHTVRFARDGKADLARGGKYRAARPHNKEAAAAATGFGGQMAKDAGFLCSSHVSGAVPLQHRLRRDIGFLQFDAPVPELFKRNGKTGDGATHERARPYDAEITVEVFDLGLAGHRGWAIGTIQQLHLRRGRDSAAARACSNIMTLRYGRNTRFVIVRDRRAEPVASARDRVSAGIGPHACWQTL